MFKKRIPQRIVIYPKDVEAIMACSPRSARRYVLDLKKLLGKEKHQFLTIPEFCEFYGLNEEDVREFII